jgi:hypothetical protein
MKRDRTSATPLTLLTPIRPGEERELEAYLAQLPRDENSPFRRLSSTHFARWAVIDRLASDYAGAPSPVQPLHMSYLLFSSTFNGPVREYLEELRVRLGAEADTIWGHCVNYPGHRRPGPFRRYLLHNEVPVHLWYTAYDATVTEVRAAVDLRRRHIEFARRVQELDDDKDLHRAFIEEFGG